MKNVQWQFKEVIVRNASDVEVFSANPPIIGNFYVSSYACPYCGKAMYKTVFPVGEEYPIKTNRGNKCMKRVFTCLKCFKFLTAVDDKLNSGRVYELAVTGSSYREILEDMNINGTTSGRPD
jgi:hypothetical protein